MSGTWIVVLAALTVVMASAWIVQWRVGNAGWIDVLWTFGTGLGGIVCALSPIGAVPARQMLLAAMVGFWSLRLGLYVARRVARLGREDVRYARFRQDWGSAFQRRMTGFIIVQAPIAAVLDGAVMLAAQAPGPFPSAFDLAGLILFLCALSIEAAADRQMRRFRKQPNSDGKVCDQGLWSVSRHPNYVGEFLLWCAYPLIAIGNSALAAAHGSPLPLLLSVLSLVAPATLYWLLVHVSGVPPLEREMLATRGDAYRAYQQRVPVFLPSLSTLSRTGLNG